LICSFKKDDWLSYQVGKAVYRLFIDKVELRCLEHKWNKFKLEHKKENFFVFSKISTDAVILWQCLEKFDFRLIDTNLKFELNDELKTPIRATSNIQICFAEKEHKLPSSQIARDNFIYSRFHLDTMISNEVADKLKQNWVENYFLGKRGDKMVIALIDSAPVGFMQVIIKDRILIIDLIGVDKEAQGKGVASAMIQFASQNIEHSCIKVGTQISNIPSIKLYHGLGFNLSGSEYIFHYHS